MRAVILGYDILHKTYTHKMVIMTKQERLLRKTLVGIRLELLASEEYDLGWLWNCFNSDSKLKKAFYHGNLLDLSGIGPDRRIDVVQINKTFETAGSNRLSGCRSFVGTVLPRQTEYSRFWIPKFAAG